MCCKREPLWIIHSLLTVTNPLGLPPGGHRARDTPWGCPARTMATAAAGEVGGQHRYGRRTMPSLQGGGQVRSRRALGAARA